MRGYWGFSARILPNRNSTVFIQRIYGVIVVLVKTQMNFSLLSVSLSSLLFYPLHSLSSLFQHSAHYEHLLLTFIQMPHGYRMVSLWLEEMDVAMEAINSASQWVCMLMMIKKLSMSLIGGITILWDGNGVRRVAKWLPVEMEVEVGLISCLTQEM